MVRLLAGAQRSSLPDSDDSMSQPHSNNNNHRTTTSKQHHQPPQPDQQHTLVLLQPTPHPTSKTYSDHPSLDTALDAIVAAFELQLSRTPHTPQHLQYDIAQLFAYVDRLPDLAVLLFEPALRAYQPHDKQWIKSAIYEHLKRQAAGQ